MDYAQKNDDKGEKSSRKESMERSIRRHVGRGMTKKDEKRRMRRKGWIRQRSISIKMPDRAGEKER